MGKFYDDYEATEHYLSQDIELDVIMTDVFCDYLTPRIRLSLLEGYVSEEDKERVYENLLDVIVANVVHDLDYLHSWDIEDENDPEIRRICEKWLNGVAI